MKYLIIQGDGMGDHPEAERLTPLEAAHIPHMDRIARCGMSGLVEMTPPGFQPGSDVGNMALLGYDPRVYLSGRSPLEAAAMGVRLEAGDIAFRMNLITLDPPPPSKDLERLGPESAECMADFAGGHISSEDAAALVEALRADVGSEAFHFYPGVSYRHLMVWHGGRTDVRTTPPHDIPGQRIGAYLPQGEGADALLPILRTSRRIFATHPIAQSRAQAGHPVHQVWLWGQGAALQLPSFQELYQLRGACISAVDLVRGLAVLSGLDVLDVPGATGFTDTDYAAKGRYAWQALQDYDLVLVHIEAPDEAGHMGSRTEKIRAIEAIDREILGPLLDKLPSLGEGRVLITSDHATPVALRTHSIDAVPYAMASFAAFSRPPTAPWREYGERPAAQGVRIAEGQQLLPRLLDRSPLS